MFFTGLNNEITPTNEVKPATSPPTFLSPPYRMPPQPPGGSSIYSESHIPGATITEVPLRTHSSKFPVSLICFSRFTI